MTHNTRSVSDGTDVNGNDNAMLLTVPHTTPTRVGNFINAAPMALNHTRVGIDVGIDKNNELHQRRATQSWRQEQRG